MDTLSASLSNSGGTNTAPIAPGNILETNAPGGLYTTTITGSKANELFVGPVNVQIEQRNNYIYVLAGTTTNNSVQLVGPAVIAGVF